MVTVKIMKSVINSRLEFPCHLDMQTLTDITPHHPPK
jgi:hypothetical protein